LSHCVPGKSKNGGDRLPPIACARKWLQKEIELVNNEIFIIIGSKSAGFIFPDDNYNELIFKDNSL
jgi:uracil-DNA glycosylase